MRGVVIIPCGKAKQPTPQPAGRLYTGAYFRACLRYAQTLAQPDRIFILSALYGLLALTDVVTPYELRMGEPGCVTLAQVRRQAAARGLLGASVVALGGRNYTDVCRAVWHAGCKCPLAGQGGIGKQMAWMKRDVETRKNFPF
jgi:hypothetical protein